MLPVRLPGFPCHGYSVIDSLRYDLRSGSSASVLGTRGEELRLLRRPSWGPRSGAAVVTPRQSAFGQRVESVAIALAMIPLDANRERQWAAKLLIPLQSRQYAVEVVFRLPAQVAARELVHIDAID